MDGRMSRVSLRWGKSPLFSRSFFKNEGLSVIKGLYNIFNKGVKMSDDVLKEEKTENLVDQDEDQVNLAAVEDIAAHAKTDEKTDDNAEDETAEPSLEEQLAETKDQLLRSLAEVENIRKRSQREKEETAQYAVTSFARDLLSVADNLNRAVESLSSSDQKEAKGLLEGVEITEKELLKVLEKHRIKKIEALDQPFDPNFHQAMVEIPSEDKEPGTIIQEMQIGYTIAGRLLRPALVGVAKK